MNSGAQPFTSVEEEEKVADDNDDEQVVFEPSTSTTVDQTKHVLPPWLSRYKQRKNGKPIRFGVSSGHNSNKKQKKQKPTESTSDVELLGWEDVDEDSAEESEEELKVNRKEKEEKKKKKKSSKVMSGWEMEDESMRDYVENLLQQQDSDMDADTLKAIAGMNMRSKAGSESAEDSEEGVDQWQLSGKEGAESQESSDDSEGEGSELDSDKDEYDMDEDEDDESDEIDLDGSSISDSDSDSDSSNAEEEGDQAFLHRIKKGHEAILKEAGVSRKKSHSLMPHQASLQARMIRMMFNNTDVCEQIHRCMVEFIRKPHSECISLPPVPKQARRFASTAADFYGLRLQLGSRKLSLWTIHRTEQTPVKMNSSLEKEMNKIFSKLLTQRRRNERFTDRSFKKEKSKKKKDQSKLDSGDRRTAKKLSKSKQKSAQKPERMSSQRGRPKKSFPDEPSIVVGADSAPIGAGGWIGWAPGKALGTHEQGITEPLEAVKRQKQRGLGY